MHELFLLGAGASIEAGIPGAYAMTKVIADRLRQDTDNPEFHKVADFVIGGLLFREGIRGNNPLLSGVNVEEFFNAVQLLAQRHTIEASPFIASWHARVEELDQTPPTKLDVEYLSTSIIESLRGQVKRVFSEQWAIDAGALNVGNALAADLIPAIMAAANGVPFAVGTAQVSQAIRDMFYTLITSWVNQIDLSTSAGLSTLQYHLPDLIERTRIRPGQGQVFLDTANQMIYLLTLIVWIDSPSRVKYLHPLVNVHHPTQRRVIATLNYDNSVELAAKECGIHCHTCLKDWAEKGMIDIRDNGLHLLKLHGSIDWRSREVDTNHNYEGSKENIFNHWDGPYKGPKEHVFEQWDDLSERIAIHEHEKDSSRYTPGGYLGQPAVIFGGRNKLTAEGPFLDLLRVFQEELMISDRLTIIGYSFSDDHINTYITRWLNRSGNHHLRIINPSFEAMNGIYVQQLKEFQKIQPKRVEVIAKGASEALADFYS